MNTLTFPFSPFTEVPRDKASGQDPYASEAQTKTLLRLGAQYRLKHIQAADMITNDEARDRSGHGAGALPASFHPNWVRTNPIWVFNLAKAQRP
jgi:hypothetical protein